MATKKKRRWYSFSLRSVIILITISAVAIRVYLSWLEPLPKQQVAAEALTEKGVTLAWRPLTGVHRWLASWYLEPDTLRECVTIQAERSKITDEDLELLRDLPTVQRLYLARTKVTDKGMHNLKTLKDLQRLSLWGTSISNEGMQHIGQIQSLRTLDIHEPRFGKIGSLPTGRLHRGSGYRPRTSKCLQDLREMPNLRSLLFAFAVDDDAIQHLVSIPNLRIESLVLENTTPKGMHELSRLPHLKQVAIQNEYEQMRDARWKLGANSLQELRDLRRLERLTLRRLEIAPDEWHPLGDLSSVQELVIVDTKIDGVGLRAVGGLSNLERLVLSNTDTIDDDLRELAGLNLESLSLNNTDVTADCLEHLAHMSSLKVLGLDTLLDDEAAGYLAQMSPELSLNIRNRHASLRMTDVGLARLPKLPSLQGVMIYDAKWNVARGGVDISDSDRPLTDEGLTKFFETRFWRQISLYSDNVTPAAYAWNKNLVGCYNFSHHTNQPLSEMFDQPLRRMTNLQLNGTSVALNGSQRNGPQSIYAECVVTPNVLDILAQLPDLRNLHVSRLGEQELPSDAWQNLRHVPNLTSLLIYEALAILDAPAIEEVGKLTNLNTLHCRIESGLTAREIAPLGNLANMRHLHLKVDHLTPHHIEAIGRMTSLQVLEIHHEPSPNDKPVVLSAFRSLKRLRQITIDNVTNEQLADLVDSKTLRNLILPRSRLTAEGMEHFEKLPFNSRANINAPLMSEAEKKEIRQRFPRLSVR